MATTAIPPFSSLDWTMADRVVHRPARAYTAIDRVTVVGEDQSLSGGGVLPGFEVSLGYLFARATRHGPA